MSEAARLALALVSALDDESLDLLADRLAPRLTNREERRKPGRLAYTVSTLAAELAVSTRTVRAAIERGELAAVKRGGRWVIAADAVERWAQAPEPTARTTSPTRRRQRTRGSLAGVVAELDARSVETR